LAKKEDNKNRKMGEVKNISLQTFGTCARILYLSPNVMKMAQEKFHIEYFLDQVSRKSLWNHIATPIGLSTWFADSVTIKDDVYTFKWNKEEQKAVVISNKTEDSIRFHWIDDEEKAYFEFRIHTLELTGTTSLEVTDFADPDEKKDSIELWDTQIDELKRTLGI